MFCLKEKNKFDNANEKTQALIEGCDNSQEYERISNKIRGVLDTNNVIEKDIIYLIDEYFDKIQIIERESNTNYIKFLEYLQSSYDKKERTLEDIGWEMNLTRERIRQIEKKAYEKIRKHHGDVDDLNPKRG